MWSSAPTPGWQGQRQKPSLCAESARAPQRPARGPADTSVILAAVLWVLTNKVKQTKKLHAIIFIAISADIGIIFGFAGV